MTNERLEQIKDSVDFRLSAEKHLKVDKEVILEEKELLDYITNLQEENEKVHKDFDELSERYFFTKSRIDNAIEKLKTLIPICIMPNNMLIHGTEKAKTIEETLNILNGDDEQMNKKFITLDYEEYLELNNRLKNIEELLSELYNEVTEEQQKEIRDYMTKYCNWI